MPYLVVAYRDMKRAAPQPNATADENGRRHDKTPASRGETKVSEVVVTAQKTFLLPVCRPIKKPTRRAPRGPRGRSFAAQQANRVQQTPEPVHSAHFSTASFRTCSSVSTHVPSTCDGGSLPRRPQPLLLLPLSDAALPDLRDSAYQWPQPFSKCRSKCDQLVITVGRGKNQSKHCRFPYKPSAIHQQSVNRWGLRLHFCFPPLRDDGRHLFLSCRPLFEGSTNQSALLLPFRSNKKYHRRVLKKVPNIHRSDGIACRRPAFQLPYSLYGPSSY